MFAVRNRFANQDLDSLICRYADQFAKVPNTGLFIIGEILTVYPTVLYINAILYLGLVYTYPDTQFNRMKWKPTKSKSGYQNCAHNC